MDNTRGTEAPREMLSRRLADAVGPNSQIHERAATEENELRCLLGNQSLTAPLPSSIPDFIGSEHEVWSDGEWVKNSLINEHIDNNPRLRTSLRG